MQKLLHSGLLGIAACTALGLRLHAQTVLYSTDFPDAQGWTFTGSLPPDPTWAVDATPFPGFSAPFSPTSTKCEHRSRGRWVGDLSADRSERRLWPGKSRIQ